MGFVQRCALAFWLVIGACPAESQVASVTVVDGDTVEVGGVRWRLDGIDAPEIHKARCGVEREKGILVAARLIALLAQRSGGRIVPTINTRGRVADGGFGRKRSVLLFGDGTAWADVAVAEGHAVPYAYGKQALPSWCPAGS